MNKLLIVFLLFAYKNIYAQKPSELVDLQKKYPDEDGVFLNLSETVEVKIEDDSVKIYDKSFSKLYMLKDNTAPYADKQLAYSTFVNVLEINAVTLVPSGDKFREVKVSNMKDVDNYDGSVFYDDTRYKKFIFPSFTKGCIAQLAYEEKYNEPRFAPSFYFASYCPVLKASYSITFPSNVKVSYKFMGKNTDKIHFTESTLKGKTTYLFTSENIDKWEFESNAPPFSNYTPQLLIFINEATINGKTFTYLKEVPDLYKWYNSLVQNVNKKPNTQLTNIVNTIINGKKTDVEKAKAIFYWVQNNVKYIAFEAGLQGFVPEEANNVCSNKYGDCKGMASIISTMCNIAGVKAYLVWIGTRSIGYTYEEVPSPMVDNHMIAAVKDNDKWVFLDGTGEYLTYGFPTDMIQGKEALIGIDKDKFEIVKVPIVAKELNGTNAIVHVKINDNILEGSAITGFIGYSKFYKIFALRNSPESKWNTLMKNLLETGNNKFDVIDYKISGQENREDTLNFNYTFKIEDYIKKIDNEYYVNLNLDKQWKEGQIDIAQRKLDVVYDYLYENSNTISLDIPEEFEVEYLPKNDTFENNDFGFSISYSQTLSTITMKKKIWINNLELQVKDFEKWNSMIKQLNSNYKEVIVLKKK